MDDLLHKLGVDWRLLIAQMVNFAILFFVLRKLLYRPVLAMLAERRERIVKGLADAEAAERRAREVDIERAAVLHRAEEERRSMLEAAAGEVERLRVERVAAADREASAVIVRAQKETARLRQEALTQVRREAAELVGMIAQKVTADRIPASVHAQVVADAASELARAKLS